MARLVCLANAQRPGGQCIAGIDLATGQWVRPVGRDADALPMYRCMIGGKPLALLDIVEIDLAPPREIHKFQRENQIIQNWNWKLVGRSSPGDLSRYCDDIAPLFHSPDDRIPPAVLEKLPPAAWSSLQLIRPRKLSFAHDHRDPSRWRARFADAAGSIYSLKLTDAIITRRLACGERISSDCLLTVSLTKPFRFDASQPEFCYKIVAAVIEL